MNTYYEDKNGFGHLATASNPVSGGVRLIINEDYNPGSDFQTIDLTPEDARKFAVDILTKAEKG